MTACVSGKKIVIIICRIDKKRKIGEIRPYLSKPFSFPVAFPKNCRKHNESVKTCMKTIHGSLIFCGNQKCYC